MVEPPTHDLSLPHSRRRGRRHAMKRRLRIKKHARERTFLPTAALVSAAAPLQRTNKVMWPVIHHEFNISMSDHRSCEGAATSPSWIYPVPPTKILAIIQPEPERALIVDPVAPTAMREPNESGFELCEIVQCICSGPQDRITT